MSQSIDYTIHPGKKATDAIVYKGDTPVNFHTTADTYTENAKALQHFMEAFATTNTVTIYVEQKD